MKASGSIEYQRLLHIGVLHYLIGSSHQPKAIRPAAGTGVAAKGQLIRVAHKILSFQGFGQIYRNIGSIF